MQTVDTMAGLSANEIVIISIINENYTNAQCVFNEHKKN